MIVQIANEVIDLASVRGLQIDAKSPGIEIPVKITFFEIINVRQ